MQSMPEQLVKITSLQDAVQKLAEKRKSLGISQKQLAQFANLSTTSVGEIERAEVDVRLSNLLDLFRLCKIEVYLKL